MPPLGFGLDRRRSTTPSTPTRAPPDTPREASRILHGEPPPLGSHGPNPAGAEQGIECPMTCPLQDAAIPVSKPYSGGGTQMSLLGVCAHAARISTAQRDSRGRPEPELPLPLRLAPRGPRGNPPLPPAGRPKSPYPSRFRWGAHLSLFGGMRHRGTFPLSKPNPRRGHPVSFLGVCMTAVSCC
jgi:hypothetical protein